MTRVEAEALPHSGPCWSVLNWAPFSGGAARNCYATAQSLRWTVSTTSSDVVRLYGYRDSVSRTARVRLDLGAWSTITLTGPDSPSALFYTSPSLSAGSHAFELEWVNSAGSFTMDFYEVDGSTPSTTTTTAPPTTTTTTAPPTTTTTLPNICNISPADGQTAISAAISSCPNGSPTTPTVVQFPIGRTYTLTGPIVVDQRSNLVIDGGASTFVNQAPNNAATNPAWKIRLGTKITLRNLTVRGGFSSTALRSSSEG